MDLKIQQMDVKGAYLNGVLKETVYMKQPDGYGDGSGRVCQLIKTLYGLKQAGREWNTQFNEGIKQMGFTRLTSDPCAYIKRQGDQFQIVTVWVDDLLIFSTNDAGMTLTKKLISDRWEVTDLGEPSKIIGIEITRQNNSISISQKQYIESLLKKEHMEFANPVAMPLDPNVVIEPNPDPSENNRSNPFARLLGELQYIANCTRPDISFAVNRLASYTANPSLAHYGMLKRILRYLAGTRSHGITYKKWGFHKPVIAYTDAAHANTDEKKSTTGIVFISGGGAIAWKSKKQTISALSTTEAEYIALSHAGSEARWYRNLFTELGFGQQEPLTIRSDSLGAIARATNPYLTHSSRHIDLKWHVVRQLVTLGTITPEACRDAEQTADVLTKPIPRPKHRQHCNEMGLAPV
jgi:hypothetical protein